MKFLIADECNVSWDAKLDFFMYGGIVVPKEEVRALSERILMLKKDNRIERERPLKWTNNKWRSSPPLDRDLHAYLKQEILDVVAVSKSKIIVCLSPQSFYHNFHATGAKPEMKIDHSAEPRTQQYALNDTLEQFQNFLKNEDNLGMVLADKFGESTRSHMKKHCFDIFPKDSHPNIIYPIIQVENEESHLHQINDIVLGAIYFSLREMEHNFLPIIRDNFWMHKPKDYDSIVGKGFNIYPLIAKADYVKEAKKNLRDKFLRLINTV